jgi:hypothetical protein
VLKLVQNALVLFLKGKLFRDPLFVCRRIAIGAGATAALFLIGCVLLNSTIIAAVIAGLVGGALQPYLLEDVKYR